MAQYVTPWGKADHTAPSNIGWHTVVGYLTTCNQFYTARRSTMLYFSRFPPLSHCSHGFVQWRSISL